MGKRVPLLLVFVTQLASVVGDATGQRCSRVYHKRNRQRFLVSMVAVTCLQMFLVLLFVQLALPDVADQLHKKVNGTTIDVCSLPHGSPDRPDAACYAQGPLTLGKLVYSCPILLCNGLMNVLYYFGEATMYREPMGVLLIVMCALTSTFLVAPLQDWLGTGASKPPDAGAIVFGIIGALLCSIERTVKPSGEPMQIAPPPSEGSNAGATGRSVELITNDGAPVRGSNDDDRPSEPPETQPRRFLSRAAVARILRVFPLVVPFAGLSFAYALYFCMMQWYDQKCDANPWGYNSVDQVALPLYMYPAMFLANLWTDWMHARKQKQQHGAEAAADGSVQSRAAEADGSADGLGADVMFGGTNVGGPPPADGEQLVLVEHDGAKPVEAEAYETFWQAVKHSVKENMADHGQGFAFMFLYRLLINGRAVSYFFIAVEYDLSEAYFVLTLVRVLLSWLISVALVLVVPRYIHTEEAEKRQLLDKANLSAKCIGSVCVILSLLFIDGVI